MRHPLSTSGSNSSSAVAVGRVDGLATEDDVSVAQGFFSVTVRPWQVMMQAGSV